MHSTFSVSLAVIACALAGGLIWRLASRRRELPCPAWLHWLVELDNPFTKTNRAAFIIEHLGLREGMRVLDAGCGPGRLTVPAAKTVGPTGRVVALDMQAGMLDRARHKAAEAGLSNIEFIQAPLGEGVLPRAHFDRALLVTVLGEITNPLPAMNALYEALKPGGILSITEVIFDPHFQTTTTVTTLAREAGFRVKTRWGHRFAYVMHLEKPGHAGNAPATT